MFKPPFVALVRAAQDPQTPGKDSGFTQGETGVHLDFECEHGMNDQHFKGLCRVTVPTTPGSWPQRKLMGAAFWEGKENRSWSVVTKSPWVGDTCLLSQPYLWGPLPLWEGDHGPAWVRPQPPTLFSTSGPSRGPQPQEQQQSGFPRPEWFSLFPYLKFPRQNFSSKNLEPVISHLRTYNLFFKGTQPEGKMSQLDSVSYTL